MGKTEYKEEPIQAARRLVKMAEQLTAVKQIIPGRPRRLGFGSTSTIRSTIMDKSLVLEIRDGIYCQKITFMTRDPQGTLRALQKKFPS